ncbi:hypothetical protein GCK32_013547 [Trichostrongylus colubriformis]|uniref:Secreted protein n=1 Tax=Trichostrongylus colubriformis TaxID=6319 RepID=A0AAN8G0U5_TRICO
MYPLLAISILVVAGNTVAVNSDNLENDGYSDDSSQTYGGQSIETEQNPVGVPQAPGGEVVGPDQTFGNLPLNPAGNLPLNPAGAPGGEPVEIISQGPANLPQGSDEDMIGMAQGMKRTINLSDMINNATRLEARLRGHQTVSVITELISRLQRISPSDVQMLANPQRAFDNQLVDSVLVANNLINIMLAASDEELFRRPPNVGALTLASNDIDNYIRTHQQETNR